MLSLVYELVDQPEVQHEREFSSRSDALLWMRGMREDDFQWIEVYALDGVLVADGWSDCIGVLK